MANPIWITIDDGDTFEGHQGHFADTFFSNAYEENIRDAIKTDPILRDSKVEIREMTAEEVIEFPEAITFRDWLIEEYGQA